MKEIEHFLKGKSKEAGNCEDALFIGNDFVAAIDGVTTKGNTRWDGVTSGRYASLLLQSELAAIPRDIQAYELFERLSVKLDEEYKKRFSERLPLEYARAAIIVYSDFYRQIWSYGDCQCMVNGITHTHNKRIDDMNAMLRAFVSQERIRNGESVTLPGGEDAGRAAILPFLKQQYLFENENSYFGYPILNGEQVNGNLIVKYQLQEGDEFILASDGYPKLFATLKQSENYLQQMLKEDPQCIWENLSTKGCMQGNLSYDDRCFVRCVV